MKKYINSILHFLRFVNLILKINEKNEQFFKKASCEAKNLENKAGFCIKKLDGVKI